MSFSKLNPFLDYTLPTYSVLRARMLSLLHQQGIEDYEGKITYPLEALRTRDTRDPAIALLDVWALALDVLYFYQQRIQEENYLTTATEEKSIYEFAKMTGYKPLPGVAASTYLTFDIEKDANDTGTVDIPIGTQAQNIPNQHCPEQQTFEISKNFTAQDKWNTLKPIIYPITKTAIDFEEGHAKLSGTRYDLTPGNLILIHDAGEQNGAPMLINIVHVTQDHQKHLTHIHWDPDQTKKGFSKPDKPELYKFHNLVTAAIESFKKELNFNDPIVLDRHLPTLITQSFIVVKNTAGKTMDPCKVTLVETTLLERFKSQDLERFKAQDMVTSIKVERLKSQNDKQTEGKICLKETLFYIGSEKLQLYSENQGWALNPRGAAGLVNEIKVEGNLSSLKKEHILIATGIQKDTTSQIAEEAAVLSALFSQGENETTIQLIRPLMHTYTPESLIFYGNNMLATHGETITEILGSGNSAETNQKFTLKHAPLTYLPADTIESLRSTLEIRVNQILWKPTSTFIDKGPNDQCYVVSHTEANKTQILFGDGINGARLPNGEENLVATYRVGSGLSGHLPPNSLTLLPNAPLGIKRVTNLLGTVGAAKADDQTQITQKIPLTLKLLDRIVSIRDVVNFVLSAPGISKATAKILSIEDKQCIHLTIATEKAGILDSQSPILRNLLEAINKACPPQMKNIQIASYVPRFFSVGATVMVQDRFIVEEVLTQAKNNLFQAFNFEKRDLTQNVTMLEVIQILRATPGILAVHLTHLDFQDAAPKPSLKPILIAEGAKIAISDDHINKGDLTIKAAELLTIADVTLKNMESK